ncbi:MAG: hypothetical protein ABMA14_24330 [Hyphomonadaceae bacterium]
MVMVSQQPVCVGTVIHRLTRTKDKLTLLLGGGTAEFRSWRKTVAFDKTTKGAGYPTPLPPQRESVGAPG